jgi:translocation and assembly module TamA
LATLAPLTAGLAQGDRDPARPADWGARDGFDPSPSLDSLGNGNGNANTNDDDGAAAESARSVPYEVAFEGLADAEPELGDLLQQSSQLRALADRPPATEAALRRRASEDMDRLLTALQSEGFYDAEVGFAIEPGAPRTVRISVTPGPVYLLARLELEYARQIDPAVTQSVPRSPADLGLELGRRARAPNIEQAERRILKRMENHGYPGTEIADRTAVIDRDKKTMRVTWEVDPGPFRRFGPMETAGLQDVEAKYVQRFRQWRPGAVYDRAQVEATRRELVGTGLFEGIQVDRVDSGDAPSGAQVPVRFTFTERAHRTIGFGARYSTSQGPSGTAFWEHRNAFGAGERVRLELEAGLIEQRFSADLRKPRFQRDDQELINQNEIRRHETDAFQEISLATSLALSRRFEGAWTGTAGGSLELSEIEDNEGSRTFLLFGLPGTLTRDTRDDPLDPTEGTRLELAATPYLATLDETSPFLRASVGASAYLSLDDADRFVLAGRARLGSIVGSETEEVPASKRFFAGGGGSVRGFPFEAVGPLDRQDDPLGGRGLLELGLELRVKITDSIGLVPFVDAGNVYDTPYPDPGVDTPLRYAAGLGVRYFTGIGPLRLDVAVPINDRAGVDNAFEFYISLGQAF